MILVGMTGGMRQGKSTVSAELRRLAGVDAKADLEFSYPIGQVANAWVKQWPQSVLESGLPTVEIANKLIPLLAEPIKAVTGLEVEINKLLIADAASERDNRLISYLENYIEAGEGRSSEFPLPITPDNKVLHRELYQWLGARLIDEVDAGDGQDVWTTVIEKRIKTLQERGYTLVTVGGARYPLHQQMIHRNGGVIVDVERPGMQEDSDITERAGDNLQPDVRILNNGTMAELNAAVGQLYTDLVEGNPKARYSAV